MFPAIFQKKITLISRNFSYIMKGLIHMTAFEQSMLSLKSENIEIVTNIRTLFACTPDMLKLDNSLVAESCVSYLYV